MSAKVIAEPLANLINLTVLDFFIFQNFEKEASIIPVLKKEDQQIKTNYKPISVLNVQYRPFVT